MERLNDSLNDSARLALLHQTLVHRRHGLITTLLEETEHPDARGLFVFNALMVDVRALMHHPARSTAPPSTSERASLAGSGAAFERSAALWAAFGEAIERYAAAVHHDDQLHYASQHALGQAALGLEHYILFSPEQYASAGWPYAAPDASLRRAWVRATDLCDPARLCYVPAQLVYLGMQVQQPHEIIFQSSSTGLACGQDGERAMLGGLCEVIERDAFAAMWQMRYVPRRLLLDQAARATLLPGVQRALAHATLDVRLWDITTDIGVPVVLCLARSRTDGTMSCGASAQLRVGDAVNKAVTEALHGYAWASALLGAATPLPQRSAIRQPGDHFAYFLQPERQQTLDFLLSDAGTIASSDASLQQLASFDALLARLRAMGLPALVVDVTSDDIASLDLCVVRALIPGLHPLLFGDGMLSLDQRRLRQIARHWGLAQVPPPNLDPHPFP